MNRQQRHHNWYWWAMAGFLLATPLQAADWIVAPSYYTHDTTSGQRVAQYAPIGPVYTYQAADYVESGFQHYRSSIVFDGTADNYFRVKEWGRPVRPYGEWRFPYRPYSVPFPLWNTPYYGMYQFNYGSLGYGLPGYGRPGYGRPGGGAPGRPGTPRPPGPGVPGHSHGPGGGP